MFPDLTMKKQSLKEVAGWSPFLWDREEVSLSSARGDFTKGDLRTLNRGRLGEDFGMGGKCVGRCGRGA